MSVHIGKTYEDILPVVAILMGSDSDRQKIEEIISSLDASAIVTWEGIKSIHRTPAALEKFCSVLPDLPESIAREISWVSWNVKAIVSVVIWAAGWAAHLPGGVATYAPATVCIAYPVESRAWKKVSSLYSMLDMPPEVPNGVALTPAIAATMAKKIMHLDLPEGYNKVSVPEWMESQIPQDILTSLWIEIDQESPIKIELVSLEKPPKIPSTDDIIHIAIPTYFWDAHPEDVANLMLHLDQEALFMGQQTSLDINFTNALIFATQILATKNRSLEKNLKARRKEKSAGVMEKDATLEKDQTVHIVNKARLLASWLWPKSKVLDYSGGDARLKALWYTKFYSGKNADIYIVPNQDSNVPIDILMVRSDRTSVFNIPLDLEIEGKWEVQNQVSLLWANFAQMRGIWVINSPLPETIPESLRWRSQVIELCNQLEIEVDGKKQGLELIFRNYITGTYYKAITSGNNPYGIDIPSDVQEWDDIRLDGLSRFTPTDKTKNDNPIETSIVEKWLQDAGYGDIVPKLQQLFAEFTAFAYQHGYVVVDTKFEVFINSKWEWVLGDEILTPESSRFIKVEDFETGKYISADKQMIRNIGKKFDWEGRWATLKKENPSAKFFPVSKEVSIFEKSQVLQWYRDILQALS